MSSAKAGRKPVSSLDLARLCGVSQGTVDRALHGRGRIAETTRRRVAAVAAKYGYLPNPAARELMTGSSSFVGAIVPSVNSVFFMDLMDALCIELRKHSLRLVMASASNGVEGRELLEEFAGRRMRGIVLVSPDHGLAVSPVLARQQKIFSLINPSGSSAVPFIGPDEENTGRAAVAYLARRGHRRIMHLSYARRSWAIKEREKGYRRGLHALGEKPCILNSENDLTIVAKIRTWKPTALFCHNDWLALSAIRLLTAHGIRVPADMSVIGTDNSPTFNTLYSGMTTLQYPFESVAEAVVSRMLGHPSRKEVLPCTVVERESVSQLRQRSPQTMEFEAA